MKATHYWRPTSVVPDRKKEVLVDCDGPLALFDQAMLDIVFDLTGRRYVLEDIKGWEIFESIELSEPQVRNAAYTKVKAEGGCLGLPLHPLAQDGIKKLQKVAEVIICTSPFYGGKTWVYEREAWLKQHFKIDGKEIIHARRKYHIAGDMLVDDKPEHLEKWSLRFPAGQPVLWATMGNRGVKDFPRVESWEEVLALLGK